LSCPRKAPEALHNHGRTVCRTTAASEPCGVVVGGPSANDPASELVRRGRDAPLLVEARTRISCRHEDSAATGPLSAPRSVKRVRRHSDLRHPVVSASLGRLLAVLFRRGRSRLSLPCEDRFRELGRRPQPDRKGFRKPSPWPFSLPRILRVPRTTHRSAASEPPGTRSERSIERRFSSGWGQISHVRANQKSRQPRQDAPFVLMSSAALRRTRYSARLRRAADLLRPVRKTRGPSRCLLDAASGMDWVPPC